MAKVDKESKLAALMISGLMMTAPDDLAEFRRRRLGRDSEVDVEQLRRAREVALWLADAIHSDDADRWTRLAEVRQLLGDNGAGEVETEASTLDDKRGDKLPFYTTAVATAELSAEELVAITAGSPELTVAQYAALCATCGAFPDRIEETHAKFGLANRSTRDALDNAWQACFDADPRLEELWQALFQRFRAWLVQYGNM